MTAGWVDLTADDRPVVIDFRVDYREKVYAAGKFPGGFIKREGRPTTKEILTSRLIDRPIRPLFPESYRDAVQIQAGPISADRLKSFVERIEKLEEERKAIGSDIKDVYSEAKGVGYDVKTMRKIVSLRSMDAADRAEQETLLDVYKHALGIA